MKKVFLSLAILGSLVLISCENGVAVDNTIVRKRTEDTQNDTSTFNIPMSEVIQASQGFVKESIKNSINLNNDTLASDYKFYSNDTLASDYKIYADYFVTPSSDDKKQGKEGGNWNVPTNIYGTSLTAAENTLTINGEDLGTLVDLKHYKNTQGQYRKAIFSYKKHIYYVLYKNDFTSKSEDNYVIISTTNDINPEHIVMDQAGKINTPDFSNFKFWKWDKDGNGNYYCYANLGYASTLRNVTMLDGSKATITTSCYNYYNYGFRVWIKDQGNETVSKTAYPNTDLNTTYKNVIDLHSKHKDSEYDFIFRIKNNTDKDIHVANYISRKATQNFDRSIITVDMSLISESNIIPNHTVQAGQTLDCKYSIDELKTAYTNGTWIGTYLSYNMSYLNWGWGRNLDNTSKGKVHTVTITAIDGNNEVITASTSTTDIQ